MHYDEYGTTEKEEKKPEEVPVSPLRLLYGIVIVSLCINALLLIKLYGLPFVPSFDSHAAQLRASRILSSIHHFYFEEDEAKANPVIQRANFYAYGGLTLDVSNAPEGEAEILMNGKDISVTLKHAGSFVSADDGMTYERYDLTGSMEDLALNVGTNVLVMRYATATPPVFMLDISKQQKKDYEKTYHQKLFNEKQNRRHRN